MRDSLVLPMASSMRLRRLFPRWCSPSVALLAALVYPRRSLIGELFLSRGWTLRMMAPTGWASSMMVATTRSSPGWVRGPIPIPTLQPE